MPIQMIKLTKLAADPSNARKTYDKEGIAQLAENIAHVGVKQSLLVREDGKGGFLVTAGGRRLRALQLLDKKKRLVDDFAVPCITTSDDDAAARESSLAENVMRSAMDPVEEFEAFAELHTAGASVPDIAMRFAVPERRVRQRLALAALSSKVLKALKAGEISMEAAQAFTLAPDHKAQNAWLNQASGWMLQARAIREHFTKQQLSSLSPLTKFLGEEAYLAAGGTMSSDLFGEESFWTSHEVIEQLKQARFAELSDSHAAEGWAFVRRASDYPQGIWSLRRHHAKPIYTAEQEARREELEVRMAELEEQDGDEEEYRQLSDKYDSIQGEIAFTAEQKAQSGVIVDLERGSLYFGIIDPKIVEPEAEEKVDGKPAKDPLAISAPLQQSLSEALTLAMRDAVRDNRKAALAVLAATLACKIPYGSYIHVPVALDVSQNLFERRADETRTHFSAELKRYLTMDEPEIVAAIAEYAAELVDLTDRFNFGGTAIETRNATVEAIDPSAFLKFHFDAQGYASKVSKPVLAAAIRDLRNGQNCDSLEKVKKGDLAKLLISEIETRPEGDSWLPPQLRTKGYAGPAHD